MKTFSKLILACVIGLVSNGNAEEPAGISEAAQKVKNALAAAKNGGSGQDSQQLPAKVQLALARFLKAHISKSREKVLLDLKIDSKYDKQTGQFSATISYSYNRNVTRRVGDPRLEKDPEYRKLIEDIKPYYWTQSNVVITVTGTAVSGKEVQLGKPKVKEAGKTVTGDAAPKKYEGRIRPRILAV